MQRKVIFAGLTVLLMGTLSSCIAEGEFISPPNPLEGVRFVDEIFEDLGPDQEAEQPPEAGKDDEAPAETVPSPTPAATSTPGPFPEMIKDAEDDLRVECDGEPTPGAGPDWSDIVEVTRVSENVFEVTFRGEARPVTEDIKQGDGEDVPEHLGVSLIVQTPEDEYIEYGVDWYSYYPQGEREEVGESAPDAAFKALFNPVFEWVDARTLRITLEPENRDVLALEAEYQVSAFVDLAGAEPPYACDMAPERN